MSTEELERRLQVTIEALEQMCRIVESMEKLLQVAITERDNAISYIQASEAIGKAKL